VADDRVRIEVGFDGGQAMALLVTSKEADELERTLADGTDNAFSVDSDDGRYTLALKRIVYVKRFGRESRVGFST
jgi:hypothetical protein